MKTIFFINIIDDNQILWLFLCMEVSIRKEFYFFHNCVKTNIFVETSFSYMKLFVERGSWFFHKQRNEALPTAAYSFASFIFNRVTSIWKFYISPSRHNLHLILSLEILAGTRDVKEAMRSLFILFPLARGRLKLQQRHVISGSWQVCCAIWLLSVAPRGR